ncbi:hypothetical protein ABTZ44_06585 [Microbacterium oxydans]|nr:MULTISPECIES: hypothetical protein [Microbacterium]
MITYGEIASLVGVHPRQAGRPAGGTARR